MAKDEYGTPLLPDVIGSHVFDTQNRHDGSKCAIMTLSAEGRWVGVETQYGLSVSWNPEEFDSFSLTPAGNGGILGTFEGTEEMTSRLGGTEADFYHLTIRVELDEMGKEPDWGQSLVVLTQDEFALIKAETLREAAVDMRSAWEGSWNLRDPKNPESAYSVDRWLEVRADRLAGGEQA